ncbi:siderophore-interacting protein [Actinoplanes sp. NPDC051859]|uniref:siderophore-interacting protein n=1 Tax=Actinoplanes sp. NPDC051859 TaxID=3363909 RepID=UPI0037B4D34C
MGNYKLRKPVNPQVLLVEVQRTARVTPNVIRVTVSAEGFTPQGYDQWFRLFLPREGQEHLRLPTRTSNLWYAQYLTTPKARRPWVRNYTVRAFRPDTHELDIDFVVHTEEDGSAGPAAAFALTAKAGDQVGLLDQGCGYNPRHPHNWTLLVTDETGLPAVAGICGSLPDDAQGIAIVEVPSEADKQEFRVPAGIDLRWIVRGPDEHVPGRAALAALKAADLPVTPVYAFLAGESSLATGGRRFLVEERQIPKQNLDFIGYWRYGHSQG